MSETVKVAFVKEKTYGEIVAVFPEIIEDHTGEMVQVYVHHGQHGEGSLEWAKEQDKATFEEIVPLYNELREIGYDMIFTTL